jgi:ubiquitin-protein ligase
MDRQRILKEAQQIAKEFSFWMVSGNVAHLYGYVYEVSDRKFEMEIKFDDSFPNSPPQMIYTDEIKNLLGKFKLVSITNWKSENKVVEIVRELKTKILNKLKQLGEIAEDQVIQIKEEQIEGNITENEKYITPDLNVYPPDFQHVDLVSSSDSLGETVNKERPMNGSSDGFNDLADKESYEGSDVISQEEEPKESGQLSVLFNTELGLIQQIYAYDQPNPNQAIINVYITVTLSKTFIISINFANYPKLPIISFPDEIKKILDDPYRTLSTLKNWDSKNPVHVVDILHELENKLFFIKDIESQSKQI